MPRLGPYAALTAGVCLVIGGLILAAVLVGWWGLRKALRHRRMCRECGRWGTDMDILIHECLEHEGRGET